MSATCRTTSHASTNAHARPSCAIAAHKRNTRMPKECDALAETVKEKRCCIAASGQMPCTGGGTFPVVGNSQSRAQPWAGIIWQKRVERPWLAACSSRRQHDVCFCAPVATKGGKNEGGAVNAPRMQRRHLLPARAPSDKTAGVRTCSERAAQIAISTSQRGVCATLVQGSTARA
jgi:hypothetical protein